MSLQGKDVCRMLSNECHLFYSKYACIFLASAIELFYRNFYLVRMDPFSKPHGKGESDEKNKRKEP